MWWMCFGVLAAMLVAGLRFVSVTRKCSKKKETECLQFSQYYCFHLPRAPDDGATLWKTLWTAVLQWLSVLVFS